MPRERPSPARGGSRVATPWGASDLSLGTPHALHGLRMLFRLAKIVGHTPSAYPRRRQRSPSITKRNLATRPQASHAINPSTQTHADEVGSDE